MASTDTEPRPIPAADLRAFCAAVFVATGVPAEQAAVIATNLVDADLRGVESHGVVRLPIYARRLAARATNPTPTIRTVRETRTTAVLDGDNGMGQWVSIKAMELALAKAKDGDCAFVTVRNSNHFGAAAPYASMGAEAGMIGIATTIGGINHMAPWGGAEAMLGNNPFAGAFPAGHTAPSILLHMACSAAPPGQITVAPQGGRPIPPAWPSAPTGSPPPTRSRPSPASSSRSPGPRATRSRSPSACSARCSPAPP